jgi:hypothetical protein
MRLVRSAALAAGHSALLLLAACGGGAEAPPTWASSLAAVQAPAGFSVLAPDAIPQNLLDANTLHGQLASTWGSAEILPVGPFLALARTGVPFASVFLTRVCGASIPPNVPGPDEAIDRYLYGQVLTPAQRDATDGASGFTRADVTVAGHAGRELASVEAAPAASLRVLLVGQCAYYLSAADFAPDWSASTLPALVAITNGLSYAD